MAGTKEAVSDTENVEKPVREQLKKARINTAEIKAGMAPEAMTDEGAVTKQLQDRNELRGRHPHKKRSIEEEEDDAETDLANVEGKHRRKRSRDSTLQGSTTLEDQTSAQSDEAKAADVKNTTNGDEEAHVVGTKRSTSQARSASPEESDVARTDEVENFASPKNKRSRLHSSVVPGKESATDTKSFSEDPDTKASMQSTSKDLEGKTGEPQLTSGFSNTSATSPFGTITGSKGGENASSKPSMSFASSGFGALSKTSASGFGALGQKSAGLGGGSSIADDEKNALGTTIRGQEEHLGHKSSGAVFGGALGQKSAFAVGGSTTSGFGSGTSTFGKIGQSTGFASGIGGSGFGNLSGTGLSSFASGKPSAGFASSSKSSKAFGASADDEDDNEEKEGDDDEAGFKSPVSQDEDRQDERFYHQDLETGEEDEMTEYSCRAKLYNFTAIADGKKEWRERGLGILRLNVSKGFKAGEDEEASKAKTQARFLMRADGSHRVVLNTPIKKEIKFGAPTGGAPQGGLHRARTAAIKDETTVRPRALRPSSRTAGGNACRERARLSRLLSSAVDAQYSPVDDPTTFLDGFWQGSTPPGIEKHRQSQCAFTLTLQHVQNLLLTYHYPRTTLDTSQCTIRSSELQRLWQQGCPRDRQRRETISALPIAHLLNGPMFLSKEERQKESTGKRKAEAADITTEDKRRAQRNASRSNTSNAGCDPQQKTADRGNNGDDDGPAL
nr:brefeldin a resistance protein [Quercus suber]